MADSVNEYFRAAKSVVEAKREADTKSPFLISSLAAMKYASESHGAKMSSPQAEKLLGVLKLGVVANNFYDINSLDIAGYRSSRELFIRDFDMNRDYVFYYRDLRSLERERPVPGVENEFQTEKKKIIDYREKVNAVSIAISVSGAGLGRYQDVVDEKQQIRPECPKWIKAIYWSVMALQVADDKIGWRGDVNSNRPSFYTAFVHGNLTHKQIFEEMGLLAENYLKKSQEGGVGKMGPIVEAAKIITKIFPGIVEITRKIGAHKFVTTRRDRTNT